MPSHPKNTEYITNWRYRKKHGLEVPRCSVRLKCDNVQLLSKNSRIREVTVQNPDGSLTRYQGCCSRCFFLTLEGKEWNCEKQRRHRERLKEAEN